MDHSVLPSGWCSVPILMRHAWCMLRFVLPGVDLTPQDMWVYLTESPRLPDLKDESHLVWTESNIPYGLYVPDAKRSLDIEYHPSTVRNTCDEGMQAGAIKECKH